MIARRSLSRTLVALCVVVGGLLFAWSAPALAQREHVFSKSFGSEGAGDGQLSQPGQLAVSEVGPAAGDVYVIDRGNDRVEVFDGSTGAYVTQFNGSASPTGAFSWPRPEIEFPREGAIAIDNSTNPLDPSAGDVYVADMGHKVIDKFSPSGAYIGQLIGTQADFPFLVVVGVAVDSNGALWVQARNFDTKDLHLREFNDAAMNEFVSETLLKFIPTNSGVGELSAIGFAIDSEGDFYFGHTSGEVRPESRDIAKLSSAGTLLDEEVSGEELATGVAVDRTSNDLYVDNEASISAFTPAGGFVESFGSGRVSASSGVAVDSSTGTVYTSDATNQAIEAFTAVTVPDVSTGSSSSLGETSATVDGVVDPDGLPVTSCVFEYGTSTSYGQDAACSPEPGSGGAPVAVSASLSGLEPLTRYHFRLKVGNANGTLAGADRTFLTPVPVAVGEEAVSDVSAASALLSAQVDPGGSDTKFRFEYGATLAYGQSVPVPEGDLGDGTGVEPVSVRPEDLVPGTTYHVRIAATSALGTVYGADETFTTQSGGGAFTLPDGRMWEMVSPSDKYGAGIEPLPKEGVEEAAEDGSAISYVANGPVVASSVGNPSPFIVTQVLSRRGAGGWSSQDIVSSNATVDANNGSDAEFLFFSPDLSQGLVAPTGETPLSPEASERTEYVRNDVTGGYRPLVTAGNVPPGTMFNGSNGDEQVYGITATPDLAHVLLTSDVALTSNAKGGPERENLYDWTGGVLSLVNVLPNGEPSFRGVSLGSKLNPGVDIRHALSNDGSRVFWTSEPEGQEHPLYMRETVSEKTVQVDEPAPGVPRPPASKATFEIASATGSKVFFLDSEPLTADSKLPPTEAVHGGVGNDLYVYDTEAKTLTDLTVDRDGSEPANVQDEMLGASEDGSVVYFVATGVLASGAEAGADNLYVVSEADSMWSAPRLVAVLSPEDGPDWGVGTGGTVGTEGMLTSKVSPNGRFLAFMSDRDLTGYDSRDVSSGQPDEEVFLYDQASDRLTCVSCDPTGARPAGVFDPGDEDPLDSDRAALWSGRWLAADLPTGDHVNRFASMAYQPRYLSGEGRLFFNSFDSLVAQDTNGRADVYEYEPQAIGSCEQAGGCVSLISSGTSSQESTFLDAGGMGPGGAEGEDVFFLTASRLVLQDYDTSQDVYDAHVCSSAVACVSAPVAPPECSSGDSCKAAPSLQPTIFGAPSSATFSGSGNITSAAGEGVSTPKGAKKKPHSKRKRKAKRKGKGASRGRDRGAGIHKSLSARARR